MGADAEPLSISLMDLIQVLVRMRASGICYTDVHESGFGLLNPFVETCLLHRRNSSRVVKA
jgi:hypothetical protein